MATTLRAPAASSARVRPPGPGSDLDDRDAFEAAGGAGDARGEVEVEEEILAEALDRREAVTGDDVAERRQVVDRAHPALSLATSSAARRSAAARLDGSALPVPARSNAVPWSGDVRTKASPSVTLTVSENDERLRRDQRLVVIHADRDIVAGARGAVEHRIGGQRARRRRSRRRGAPRSPAR